MIDFVINNAKLVKLVIILSTIVICIIGTTFWSYNNRVDMKFYDETTKELINYKELSIQIYTGGSTRDIRINNGEYGLVYQKKYLKDGYIIIRNSDYKEKKYYLIELEDKNEIYLEPVEDEYYIKVMNKVTKKDLGDVSIHFFCTDANNNVVEVSRGIISSGYTKFQVPRTSKEIWGVLSKENYASKDLYIKELYSDVYMEPVNRKPGDILFYNGKGLEQLSVVEIQEIRKDSELDIYRVEYEGVNKNIRALMSCSEEECKIIYMLDLDNKEFIER